jgi:hypothetical protein
MKRGICAAFATVSPLADERVYKIYQYLVNLTGSRRRRQSLLVMLVIDCTRKNPRPVHLCAGMHLAGESASLAGPFSAVQLSIVKPEKSCEMAMPKQSQEPSVTNPDERE